MQFRRTQAEVDLSAIRQNIKEHQKLIPPQHSLMAVVKANGYGHGAVPILNVAIEQGVGWAGVSSAEEAIELREAGITIPILLMGGWYPEAISTFFDYNIIPSLYASSLAKELNKQAIKRNKQIKVHLKIETGMGRLGFSEHQMNEFISLLDNLSNLKIDGVFTHLSSADEDDNSYTEKQLYKFNQSIDQLPIRPKWIHIANSAGISSIKGAEGNLSRLGISMYGQPTSKTALRQVNLKEAITWKTAVTHLQTYQPNTPIGYNRTFKTKQESCIATVCVGYADGYSRALSNKGIVLIKGKRAPIVGRICMDMFMIDVTGIEDVELHDEVVLIGRQGSEYISATEMASWIGTINYEIVCNISARVPRYYHNT